MIESIQFQNFKVLRHTTLSLGRFTLIVGPNGSGKSTAMQALQAVSQQAESPRNLPGAFLQYATAGLEPTDGEDVAVKVIIRWGVPHEGFMTTACWSPNIAPISHTGPQEAELSADDKRPLHMKLAGVRLYSLHAGLIAALTQLQPNIELREGGAHFTGVLDRLRDHDPERFEALNAEWGRWLPEFDRILFDTPQKGVRTFLLRTREGHHAIPATDLSQGTLLALAILTLAYLPDPPPIVCLEEPDRGIHPRLLRNLQDALYRLSYPENFGETRAPVQVLATTHSPYFLDLFKDHPEEIVIAHKVGQEARFERLSGRPDIEDILGDAPLGEVWYSGILGGVPAE